MNQPRQRDSSQESDGSGGSVRKHERRAAFSQMMAENREGLGMKVIAVMVQRYGVLPTELWDLNSVSDMGAGRGIKYYVSLSQAMFERLISNKRFSIVNLTIHKSDHNVLLPNTLRRLEIVAKEYNYPLDPLPENLQELILEKDCIYNQPLVLPPNLRKLLLSSRYNQPLKLPLTLVELELGVSFNHPLTLLQRLRRLVFDCASVFDHPLALPPSLEELRIGSGFTHDVTIPNGLRKIVWCCNLPIQIPEGVSEIYFGVAFAQPVVFPLSVKKITFAARTYTHPIDFPTDLEELTWHPTQFDALVLPLGLRKLAWWSTRRVTLPLGLKELSIGKAVPLVLPEGLLKVKFCSSLCGGHYNLPESVKEVRMAKFVSFTHPTRLQHLILFCSEKIMHLGEYRIRRLTIGDRGIQIYSWPRGLKEVAFTVHNMLHPLRVPEGCKILGRSGR